jgi:hypothetical protein
LLPGPFSTGLHPVVILKIIALYVERPAVPKVVLVGLKLMVFEVVLVCHFIQYVPGDSSRFAAFAVIL